MKGINSPAPSLGTTGPGPVAEAQEDSCRSRHVKHLLSRSARTARTEKMALRREVRVIGSRNWTKQMVPTSGQLEQLALFLSTVQHEVRVFIHQRWTILEARGGERKLAGLPVVCCWCCCCWCCCCRCCAGRCCAGCSAGAGSSAAAAAGAGWSAAAAAAAALGMLLLLPPLGGLLLLLVLLLLLPLLRWALQMLGVLQLLGGPAHRAQGGVEPRGGGGGP